MKRLLAATALLAACNGTSPAVPDAGRGEVDARAADLDVAEDRTERRNLAAANPQKLREMLIAWRDYVRETGTLEIPGLANRPGYSNGAKYYEDLKYEATLVPRTAKP